nr:hypothetical protein [Ailanthus crinkle leaf associated bluner-like virus]
MVTVLLCAALLLQSVALFVLVSVVVFYCSYGLSGVLAVASIVSFWAKYNGVSSAYYRPFMTASAVACGYTLVVCGLASFNLYVSPLGCLCLVSLALLFHNLSGHFDAWSCHWVSFLLSICVLPLVFVVDLCIHSVVVFCGVVTLFHVFDLHCAAFHTLPAPAPDTSDVASSSAVYFSRRVSMM